MKDSKDPYGGRGGATGGSGEGKTRGARKEGAQRNQEARHGERAEVGEGAGGASPDTDGAVRDGAEFLDSSERTGGAHPVASSETRPP